MKNSRQILSSILIISLSLIICAFGHIFAYGQNNGVSIDSIAYKDSENEQVRISVSFDNPNYEGDGTVICLLYNPDGRCEEVVSDKVYDFSSTKYVYVPAGYEKVRVFLWESIDNLKPLGKEMSLSFGDITKRLTDVTFDTTESDEVYETLPMGEMVYGTKFNLPSKDSLSKTGYILDGFIVNGELKTFGEEITVGEDDIIITPVFTELSSYTVEYYHQNITDDGYTKSDSYTVNDIEVGKTAKAEDKTYEGFAKSELSVNEGVVLSGGALTLKVYYDRNIYKATFDTNGGENTIGDISGKYESEITLPTEEDVTKDSHI
ncbi:MAG: hypothetical protein IKV88_07745, partial [Clostridia bacterium]|nr:hypothetical protein [Clostridia bacterium]